MSWLSKFLTSSIGRKLVMSLTGLFLIIFLLIHLTGNIMVLLPDEGAAFTGFVDSMESNPLIKVLSIVLILGFVIHIFQGFILYFKNRNSKGGKYAVTATDNASWASKNMALLGTVIFLFLIIHFMDFFVPMKVLQQYDHNELYHKVILAFQNPIYVVLYVIGMISLGFHLAHGFQSAFQTLGVNDKKYTPFIKKLGILYSVIVPLLFALIPIIVFLTHSK